MAVGDGLGGFDGAVEPARGDPTIDDPSKREVAILGFGKAPRNRHRKRQKAIAGRGRQARLALGSRVRLGDRPERQRADALARRQRDRQAASGVACDDVIQVVVGLAQKLEAARWLDGVAGVLHEKRGLDNQPVGGRMVVRGDGRRRRGRQDARDDEGRKRRRARNQTGHANNGHANNGHANNGHANTEKLVPRGRLERPTHGFSVRCSTN